MQRLNHLPIHLTTTLIETPIVKCRSSMCIVIRCWDQLSHLIIVGNSSFPRLAVKKRIVEICSRLIKSSGCTWQWKFRGRTHSVVEKWHTLIVRVPAHAAVVVIVYTIDECMHAACKQNQQSSFSHTLRTNLDRGLSRRILDRSHNTDLVLPASCSLRFWLLSSQGRRRDSSCSPRKFR